jgi:hypothetical protein
METEIVGRTVPRYLYKYCSAARATQILRDLSLYQATPIQLNDLFEFRFRSLLSETPDGKIKALAKGLIQAGIEKDIGSAIEVARQLPVSEAESAYNNIVSLVSRVGDDVMRHSGVTCFTAERNNQRMWATYGDNHAGAVIEFSTMPESCPFRDNLAKVIYTSTKIPWGPEDLLDECCRPDLSRLHFLMQFKHADWRDENEWRILFICDSEMTSDERYVRFPASAVTRVFIGPRVSSDNEVSIRKAAAMHSDQIAVFKREIHESLAVEAPTGFEQIRNAEQIKYWANRIHGVGFDSWLR